MFEINNWNKCGLNTVNIFCLIFVGEQGNLVTPLNLFNQRQNIAKSN